MDTTQNNLSQFTDSAMNALRRAYEECPDSSTGSYIIIASNAIIRLENELKKSNALCGRNQADAGRHFHNQYCAAA
jgi:hypothetical protein